MTALATVAARLAAERGLEGQRKEAVLAFAKQLSDQDALEVRRLGRIMMDETALADLGLDDPHAAAAARQLVTARQMEIEGEPIIAPVAADPYAATRAMILQAEERGDSDYATRLRAGLEAVIAEAEVKNEP